MSIGPFFDLPDEGGIAARPTRCGAFANEVIGLSITASIQPLPPVWNRKRWRFDIEPGIFRSIAESATIQQ
jgi:hypothetical protein